MGLSPAVEIRHLRYFLAVAEAENFTRAAERLSVSQPSISQQIKDLETALGATLFDRLGKRVRLTQAGLAFRERAEVVLRKLEEACEAVEQVEGLLSGHLQVGVIPAVNLSWVPPVLERFAVEYPGVMISVREQHSNEIETEVESGRIDVGLGILSYASPRVTYERVLTDELAVFVPERHPLAKRDEVHVKELEGVPLVLLPESFILRQEIEELFRRAKVRPTVAFEIDTIDATFSAVHRTGMPALLPTVVFEGRKALGLRPVKLVGRNHRMDFGLMWPQGSDRSPAVRAFASLVVELATKVESARKTPPRGRSP